MKIGIMGLGVVGTAVKATMEQTHDIITFDTKCDSSAKVSKLIDTEMVFICVPTPFNDMTDQFDYSHVLWCIKRLESNNYRGIIIVKSTTLPSSISEIRNIFSLSSGIELVGCPEFLNARTANDDMKNSKFVIIGNKHYEIRNKVYEAHKQAIPGIVPVFLESAEAAMMAKYAVNGFFAVKNAYFNMINEICRTYLNEDYQAIRTAIISDERINPVHTESPGYDGEYGYGGACLPKDTKALAQLCEIAGIKFNIARIADKYNEYIRE